MYEYTITEQGGCKIISGDISLRELATIFNSNGIFQSNIKLHPDVECPLPIPVFADFSLAVKLGAIAVIGTQEALQELHMQLHH